MMTNFEDSEYRFIRHYKKLNDFFNSRRYAKDVSYIGSNLKKKISQKPKYRNSNNSWN